RIPLVEHGAKRRVRPTRLRRQGGTAAKRRGLRLPRPASASTPVQIFFHWQHLHGALAGLQARPPLDVDAFEHLNGNLEPPGIVDEHVLVVVDLWRARFEFHAAVDFGAGTAVANGDHAVDAGRDLRVVGDDDDRYPE